MKVVTTNRRARYDYDFEETYEAGLVLKGSEVKALREGRAHLRDAYVMIRDGEAWLVGAYIGPYDYARDGGHDPDRDRKLLLHRREIDRLAGKLAETGLTLIPTRIHFREGKAKVEIGLGRGKRRYDKRRAIKERDMEREMERARKLRGRR